MSKTVTLFKSNGNEDSGIVALARVKHDDGTDITTSNISDITRTVSKKSDLSNVLPEASLAPLGDFIHDPPIEDAVRYGIHDPDEGAVQGFNFEDPIPHTAFPDGSEIYEILYRFTTSTGFQFTLRGEHNVDNSIA